MKDYAKIAKNARMQQKAEEKKKIQAFVHGMIPKVCSKVMQDAECAAQAGKTHFPLDLYVFTDGLDDHYRDKAFLSLYKAVQKELRQQNLYLIDRKLYFRQCTYFVRLFFVLALLLLTLFCFIYTVCFFNFWAGTAGLLLSALCIGAFEWLLG